MKRIFYAFSFIWIAFFSFLQAQSRVLSDSVVVTANRFEVDQRLTGRRVVVISAADIQRLPVKSVDELLRNVAGVEMQARGAFGVQSDFTVRGSGFNGVLILVDGIRFNDPQTGHFLSDFPIPMSEIERIEVLRGPASAMYGADALGGVIHIFTKTATAKRPKSSATTTIGAYNTRFVEGGVRFRLRNRIKFSAVHENKSTDGQPILDAKGNAVILNNVPLTTDFTQRATSSALRLALPKTDLLFRAAFDKRDFSAWHFYTNFASDFAREATETQWYQFRANHQRDETTWTFGSAWRTHSDEYVYNPTTAANKHTAQQWTNQLTFMHEFGETMKLSGGASLDRRSIESNNLGNHSDYSGGVFATIFGSPSPQLGYTLGSRVEYDPAFGTQLMPQANLAYNLSKITLRASSGRAIRAAGYTEKYINNALTKPRGRNYGNPNLKPESAWNHEIGLDAFPQNGVSLHLTAFQRDTKNLIDYAKRTAADTVWLAQNILSVNAKGFEAELNWQKKQRRKNVELNSAYTFLDANLGTIPSGVQYKYALSNAKHILQNTLTLGIPRISISAQHLWKQPLTGNSFQTVNLKSTITISKLFGIKFTAEVRNIFDEKYSEIFDAPMPRRWWLIGLSY